MKKFAVLKKVGSFGAMVEREFDSYVDAAAFASLLVSSEDSKSVRYYIVSNIEPVAL